MSLDELFQRPQFSIPQEEKSSILLGELQRVDSSHRQRCPEYSRVSSILFPAGKVVASTSQLPFIPVSLFKTHSLSSVADADVFRVLQSSGTTGQAPSKIVLDRETAQLQTLALSRIMTHVLGPQRLPMILVEQADLVKDRRSYNARAAGLLGMMNFGRDHLFVLDSDLNLRLPELREFLRRHGNAPFAIFGFTFLIWSRFYEQSKSAGIDLSNALLIHGGGWKKLQDQAVSPIEFREALRTATGITRIYNFYGMVEQVGSVFLEGEDGYLYPPNFADVIIRDPITFEELPAGHPGVIQVISVLPRSYPGHSLMTEDLGVVHGIDTSSCGRYGKSFSVLGRIPRAELRGCSDVIAAQVQ